MGGVCERPGCARSAAAAVAIDPKRSTVWIGDLDDSAAGLNVLCAVHADDLVVPVGWQRRDIRDTPRLFVVPSTGSAPQRPRRTARRSRPRATGAAQALDTPSAPASASASPAPAHPVRTARAAHQARAAHPAGTATAERAPEQTGAEGAAEPNPTLAELHRRSTELSAATVALLDVGGDSPLLARAFRTGRAVG